MNTLFSYVDRWAVDRPDHPALVDGLTGETVCYGELKKRVARRAAALAGLGFGPGQRCIALMRRDITLVETLLAASRLGVECLPFVGPSLQRRTLDEARSVLHTGSVLFDPANSHYLTWKNPGEHWSDVTSLPGFSVSAVAITTLSNACLYLNTSSGSTGVSKMVIATHEQVIANALACQGALGFGPDATHLGTFRLHPHELFVRALVTGATAVLLSSDDPLDLVAVLKRHRVTYLMTSPLTLSLIHPVLTPGQLKPNLRVVECGGGALSRRVGRAIETATGAVVVPVWGSTETAGVALAPPSLSASSRSAIGVPLHGYHISIVDERGEHVPRGQEGEMVIRGNAVAAGYLGSQPLEVNSRLADHVFRTGDLVRQNRDGWFELRGRVNNNFKVASTWVNAERIECAIRDTMPVRDVVVVPYPNDALGCVPVALVVWDRGATADTRALMNRLEEPLLEMPHRFIAVPEIPTNGAGKVDRAGAKRLVSVSSPRQRRRRLKPLKALFLVARSLRDRRLPWRILRHPIKYLILARHVARERPVWDSGDRG